MMSDVLAAGKSYFCCIIDLLIVDVFQIHLDMAVLIEAQGDLLDNIESQVWFLTMKIIFLIAAVHCFEFLVKEKWAKVVSFVV